MDAVMDMEPAICAITKAESIENTDVITMRNINKSYRMGTQSLHVLKDVSLTVKQGEYLAILGPSGSGKSTLMNIIGCMDVMDSGNYLLDGVAIEQAKEKELVKIRNQKIGFIFQKYHLIPTYNVPRANSRRYFLGETPALLRWPTSGLDSFFSATSS